MTISEQLDQHDHQVADLLNEAVLLLAETRQLAQETHEDLLEVVAAQKRTEHKLAMLISTVIRGAW